VVFQSYSQNREDVLLNRVFPSERGFYIDVGAADPVELSVTKAFYDRGWSGVNVEPQPTYFAAIEADRPRDANLNLIVSDTSGEKTFYEIVDRSGWATSDPATADQHRRAGLQVREYKVTAITLAELCSQHVRGTIDFLKVDVEGAERAVLAGGDFKTYRPRVVVVEATEVMSSVLNHETWEPILLNANYQFAFFDGLNRFYVRDEDAELIPKLAVPANALDEYVPYEVYSSELRLKVEAQRGIDQLHEEIRRIDGLFRDANGLVAVLRKLSDDRQALLDGATAEIDVTRRRLDSLMRTYTAALAETTTLGEVVARRTKSLSRLRVAHETALNMLREARGHLDAVRGELYRTAG